MTLDLGRYIITHNDDVCWTVNEKRVYGDKSEKPGETYLRAVSHHGTPEDAVENVVRLMGDDFEGSELRLYVLQLKAVWRDVREAVREQLRTTV